MILIYPDWEEHYPLAEVYALERQLHDHTPLILGTSTRNNHTPIFRSENSWMLKDDFG